MHVPANLSLLGMLLGELPFRIRQLLNLNEKPLSDPPTGTILHLGQANGVNARAGLDAFAAPSAVFGRRANITAGAKSALAANDSIIQFGALGYGTTAYSNDVRAAVRLVANQNYTDANQGTRGELHATPDGSTTMAKVCLWDSAGFYVTGSLTVSALTSGRVPFASTAGLLVDDADLTFSADTLSATKVAMSSLTSGRVPIVSTAGLLVDDADFTFATDTLTATKVVGSMSVKAGSAGGFISSDGSPGVTGSFSTAFAVTITYKDGLITNVV